MASDAFDVVIVGGGLVGASLGVALTDCRRSVLVVEPVAVTDAAQPSFDERTVALTYCARHIFSALGIWDEIAARGSEPIREIHVSQRGHCGQTVLSHTDVGTPALGYVVPTRVLGEVLWARLEQSGNVETLCPGRVVAIANHSHGATLEIEANGTPRTVAAGLVIIADGGRSPLLHQVGIDGDRQPYPQTAVLCIAAVDRPHQGRAYERFTHEGPLALLPVGGAAESGGAAHRYAVVWTTDNATLSHRMQLNEHDFRAALQHTFGDRAGSFITVSGRKSYPLCRTHIRHPASGHVLAIGNAAHSVHPVAGQGFNLGLRDSAILAELLWNAQADSPTHTLIDSYIKARAADNRFVNRFTHGLITTFTNQQPPLPLLRSLGLGAIELLPPLKHRLLTTTMGLNQGPFALLCGLPLARVARSGQHYG